MPPLVAIAVGSLFTIAGAGGLFLSIGGLTVLGSSSILFAFGTSLIYGGVSSLIKTSGPSPANFSKVVRGRLISARQPLPKWRVIYGRVRVGGAITFLHVTGTNNEFLHAVYTVACHEIDAFEKMYFDGVEVPLDGNGDPTSGDFVGLAHAEFNLGTPDQAAFAGLVADAPTKWTSNHRQRQRAGVYVRFKFDREKYSNGVPNVTFDVRGRKPYDPRLGYNTHSANSALCVDDFLSKKENFCTRSQEADNADHIKTQCTVTATNITDPTGGITADRVTPDGGATNAQIRQNIEGNLPVIVGRELVFSRWIKAASGTPSIRFSIRNQAGAERGAKDISITTSWQKFEVSGTMLSGDTSVRPTMGGNNSWPIGDGALDVWQMQVRYGSVAGPLLRTEELANKTPVFGVDVVWENIDETALIAAANVSDEDVALDAGGTEDRYTCNGTFLTGQKPSTTILQLLTSMAGTLIYVSGQWTTYAGAFRTPTVTLDESDLSGPIQVQSRISRRELFNAVKGIYVSEANDWQPTDFPPVTNTTFEAEDQNERIFKDITLPFTTSSPTTQRLAKIDLERARRQITVRQSCKMSAYQLQVADVMQNTNSRFGWSSKTFEVAQTQFAINNKGNLGVNLILRETDSAVYGWTAEETAPVPPATPTFPRRLIFPDDPDDFPPDSDLRVYFSLDSGDGNAYGRGPDAVKIVGTDVSAIEGKAGKGIQTDIRATGGFDNGADYTAALINYGFSFWSKEGTGAEGVNFRTFCKGNTGIDILILIQQSNTELGVWRGVFEGSGFLMNTLVAGWHHIFADGHGTQTDFYVDTKFVGTANHKHRDGFRTIGRNVGTGQAWGAFDEVRIYNKQLSVNERKALFHQPSGPQTQDNVRDGFDRAGVLGSYLDGNRPNRLRRTASDLLANDVFEKAVDNLDSVLDSATRGRVLLTALTASEVDLAKAGVLNKTAANIAETGPRKWAAESGADITSGKPIGSLSGDLDDVSDGTTSKVVGQGTAFPGAPTANQFFYRTDTEELFQRNSANTDWLLRAGRSNENDSLGVTSGPTKSDSTFTDIPEMAITYTPKTTKVLMIFSGSFNLNAGTDSVLRLGPHLSGVVEATASLRDELIERFKDAKLVSTTWLYTGLTEGTSKIFQMRWKLQSGTGTIRALGIQRALHLEDIL